MPEDVEDVTGSGHALPQQESGAPQAAPARHALTGAHTARPRRHTGRVLAATAAIAATLVAVARPATGILPATDESPLAVFTASADQTRTKVVSRDAERTPLDVIASATPTPTPTPTAKPTAKPTPAYTGVAGIPQPCTAKHPYPQGASPAQVKTQLAAWSGIRLTGPEWTKPNNHTLVRIVWETLDGIGCTDYLTDVKKANPGFALYAGPTRSWAWGDWALTHPGAVTLDFAKWRTVQKDDPGRLVRILVHEIGHAWSLAPANQRVYNAFNSSYAKLGNFGPYAYSKNENFSEVIGYYVARCAKDNPYDAKKYAPYYDFVRTHVFAGREFGPAAGTKASCG